MADAEAGSLGAPMEEAGQALRASPAGCAASLPKGASKGKSPPPMRASAHTHIHAHTRTIDVHIKEPHAAAQVVVHVCRGLDAIQLVHVFVGVVAGARLQGWWGMAAHAARRAVLAWSSNAVLQGKEQSGAPTSRIMCLTIPSMTRASPSIGDARSSAALCATIDAARAAGNTHAPAARWPGA